MAIRPGNEKELQCVEYLKKEFTTEKSLDPDDTHFFDGDTYLRFARAREGNQEKAARMLRKAIEWRKTFKPYKITLEDIKSSMEEPNMAVGGISKAGRPLLVVLIGAPNECGTEARLRQMAYILEEVLRKGYSCITCMFDFCEMGKHKNDPKSKDMRKATLKMLQDYYPETLGMMLLYRATWYVRMMLPIVKPFLGTGTRKKVLICGNKIDDITKYIDKDQVPENQGGTFKLSSVEALTTLRPYDGQPCSPGVESQGGEKAY